MPASRLSLLDCLFTYGAVLLVMAVLDAAWLGWLAKDFYREALGPLMTDQVRVVPAALYYLGYPAAIVYLGVAPARSLGEAALRCAVLGVTAFGVYDLTNLAILKGYTLRMTVVDMAWGTFASAVGGSAGFLLLASRMARS